MLFPSRLLFTVTADCPYVEEPLASAPGEWPGALLPPLGELDGEQNFARVCTAWNEHGLYVAAEVPKRGAIVGNRQRPASGDGLQIWLNTDPGESDWRANEHCYHFIILPRVPGREAPLAWQEPIRRARGRAPLCDPADIQVSVAREEGLYRVVVALSARRCLRFAPGPDAELGFEYLIHDTTAGRQLWSSPLPAPYATNPSYWGRLRLVR